MASYLSIITLNINGLNAPTKRQRLAEWTQKQDPFMWSTRDPPQNRGHQKTENKELVKDISHKWRPRESRSSDTHMR